MTQISFPEQGTQRLMAGWMDRGHLLQFVQGHLAALDDRGQAHFWTEHDAMRREAASLPIPDLAAPEPHPMAGEEAAWCREVEQAPAFRQTFGSAPHCFGYLPVSCLTTFQPFLKGSNERPPEGMADVLRWCLPTTFETSSAVTLNQGNPGTVPRVLFATNDPNAQLNFAVMGDAFRVAVAPRLNWVQVARADGRYVVRNGHHRIAALAAIGRTEVPAVIIEAPTIGAIVPPAPAFFGADYLQRLERPPLVVDFLNPAVTLEIPHAPLRRVFEVRLDVAELQLPP